MNFPAHFQTRTHQIHPLLEPITRPALPLDKYPLRPDEAEMEDLFGRMTQADHRDSLYGGNWDNVFWGCFEEGIQKTGKHGKEILAMWEKHKEAQI